jgi:hypothetical protein
MAAQDCNLPARPQGVTKGLRQNVGIKIAALKADLAEMKERMKSSYSILQNYHAKLQAAGRIECSLDSLIPPVAHQAPPASEPEIPLLTTQ